MNKVAVVTGAGSGVGRAMVLKLVELGWKVALIGRREKALNGTIELAGQRRDQCLAIPCDIGDSAAVGKMGRKVEAELGPVEVLVNAAGTNIAERLLEKLSLENYQHLMDANLNGAYYCVQAFLPGMRQRKSGTIVNINSEAGKQATPKSGVAYVVSKFGMAGLTQSINAEEKLNGVRACSIFPGDIDTPLLDKRPAPPPREARDRMLKPEDIADCALLVIQAPHRAVIEEILIRPRS